MPEPRNLSRTISKRKAGSFTAFRGPNLLTIEGPVPTVPDYLEPALVSLEEELLTKRVVTAVSIDND